MIYRIVQYIQPWEIDDLDRQADQLIRGCYFLPEGDIRIIFDITLNTDIVNWHESSIPEKYFLDKFECIRAKLSNYYTTEFDTDITIRGCTDKRRVCSTKEQDFVIWLDSDMYFPSKLLPLLVLATTQIRDRVYILTPQIIKYWDNTWDCITNETFLDQPHNHRDFFDLYSLDSFLETQVQTVVKNNQIKFGGGWFNVIKNDIFKEIPLIEELGSYAPDDTYLTGCAYKLGIPQYILKGVAVSEIGKKFLVGKNYLKQQLTSKIQDKAKISDQQLHTLIRNYNG